ncbi:urea amidolyase [Clostridia bacterium]|nr:urea amidolyase [Clostridia bacterium]
MSGTISAAGLEILVPGPLTTVQDMGRFGMLGSGICPSGALDQPAARLANALAGNAAYGEDVPAVLEMTLLGITAVFGVDTIFAVTGAAMPLTLNGQPINAYESICANAGDELKCGFAESGCRAYLAVAGGFVVPRVMGSRSTHLKCGFGGFDGRKLRAGDVLPISSAGSHVKAGVRGSTGMHPHEAGTPWVVRVADGPQLDRFSGAAVEEFLRAEYTVSPQSDRMGVRLDGPAFTSEKGSDILSDGIPLGAIQITNNGQPIALLADRQTIGGYAKPFVVINADIPIMAQLRPGEKVRFSRVSMREARRRNDEAWNIAALMVRLVEDEHSGTMNIFGFKVRKG